MTTTDALVGLRAWQRAFEWELARLHHGRAGAVELVRRHSHALFDHIQIVELASLELARRIAGTPEHELVHDIAAASATLKLTVQQLVIGATTRTAIVDGDAPIAIAGDAVGAAIARAMPALAIPIELSLASPTTRVACSAIELEHLVVGMLLEASAAPRIELLVRERAVDGVPWLELVRTTPPIAPDPIELRVIEAIAMRAGGEVSRSEVRDGEELVAALPCT